MRHAKALPLPIPQIAPLPTAKRLFDVLFGLLLVAALGPLMIVTALAIWVSGRPVLFSHERVGLNGRAFRMWKFCTMVDGADRQLQKTLNACPIARAQWTADRKLSNDPRTTPLGRVLRRTSIDELPQLWNVVRGDMSLVGPRPIPSDELCEKYGPFAAAYQSVRPGVTGLWQVSGRNAVSYPSRVAMDRHYVACRTLWMDARILIKTVFAVARCDGC